MKNYVQKGETLTLTAPYAVSSGGGALVGSVFGVAANDYGNGEEGEFQVAGVFDLVRETGPSTGWTSGTLIYWDNTNKNLVKASGTGNTAAPVAICLEAVGTAVTTAGEVKLVN